MKRTHRPLERAMAFATPVVLLLAACSSSSATTPVSTTIPPSASSAPPASAPSVVAPSAVSSPGLAASPSLSPVPSVQAASGNAVQIDTILSLTGGGSFLGTEQQQAFQVLQTYVNQHGGIQGRPVQFTFADDQTDPQTAVQLANQLISKKDAAILGSSLVADCNAVIPLVDNGPFDYCLSPGIHPDAGSYAFSSSVSTADLAQAAVKYMAQKGWTSVASITSTDATGQDADNSIQAALQSNGVQLVDQEHFNPTDVSVSAQIQHIKGSNAQALIAWSTGAPIATVFKEIVQSGLDLPVFTTNGNQTYAQMQQYSAFLPQQLYIPTAEWPAYQTLPAGPVKDAQQVFFQTFQAQNVKPDIGQTLAWDPGLITIAAYQQIGPNATAGQIRDYVSKLQGFAGVNGLYDFVATPQRGLNSSDSIVTLWDPQQQTWVPAS